MDKRRLGLAGLVAGIFCLLGQSLGAIEELPEVPYGVPDSPWEEGLGNHRAWVRVEEKEEAVRAFLPWRRRDLEPEKKCILVTDAQGQRIKNVVVLTVRPDWGELVFEPSAGPGEYFIYYMPFEHSGRGAHYRMRYLPPEATAEVAWMDRHGLKPEQLADGRWKTLPQAKLLQLQARTDFDRFDPMEILATGSEVAALAAKYPDRVYLVFPEDRRYPIRMRDAVPLCWVRRGPADQLEGQARPGEFYVFQIGVYALKQSLGDISVEFAPLRSAAGAVIPPEAIRCFNLGGRDWLGRPFQNTVWAEKGNVLPLWFGVQVPPSAPQGKYEGAIAIRPNNAPAATVQLRLTVDGEALSDGGDAELWRLARLRWLDSTIGLDEEVTAPFTPVETAERTVTVLGRSLRYSDTGLPESIHAWGRELLAGPVNLMVQTKSGDLGWTGGAPKVVKTTPGRVVWESASRAGPLRMTCQVEMEFDGHVDVRLTLKALQAVQVEDVRLEIPLRRELATYMMGLTRKGGYRPPQWRWQWENRQANQVWIGEVDAGLGCKFKTPEDRWAYDSGMPESWANGGKGLIEVVEEGADRVVLRARSGPHSFAEGQERVFRFALLITPFKPLDPRHWSWRYADGWPIAFPLDRAKELGVTISNLHQSTPPNPYINYPFLALDTLSAYVQEAHRLGIKVKIYYTVRLLSNHAVELWTLRALNGNEHFFSDGTGQDRFASHPWLQEHLIRDYSCGWPEPLRQLKTPGAFDSGLNQGGLSRWQNYYLEGLRWLIENIGIDGLYLDGVGYDRQTMKRVRKVMDRAKPGCLIDLHAGNEYVYADGKVNTACRYMEHFPYVDSLWFGELFDYNESPDYWLVEISGLPFGLFGEMLGPTANPWRGMIYGMTGRYYHANRGDPRHIWKLWDEFGIQEAKMIGYWDKRCPIRTNRKDVLATAYYKKGATLAVLASWAPTPVVCQLQIDWQAVGLDPQKAHLYAPAIPGHQPEALFKPTDPIPVGNGGFFLLDEKPRKVPAPSADLYQGRRLLLEERFDRSQLAEAWQTTLSQHPGAAIQLKEGALAIKAAANTCTFVQHSLPLETALVECLVATGTDQGASWGPGMTLVWPGKVLQISLRSDGRVGVSNGETETLVQPATPDINTWHRLRVLMEAEQIIVQYSSDGIMWERLHVLPRAQYPGPPTAVRLGKTDPYGSGKDYHIPGPMGDCSITGFRVFSAKQ